MARPPIQPFTVYHVYNRGVDGRDIFMDDGDRIRFLHHLYYCNDESHDPFNFTYYCGTADNEMLLNNPKRAVRKPLVELMVYALMPNHYHLMLRQLVKGGVSRFMHSLGTGYTNFFNKKYMRSGSLFQGKYKYVPVKEEGHIIHLPHYIHMNPLPVVAGEGEMPGQDAWRRLVQYKWSSLQDYVSIHNFPSIIDNRFVSGVYGTKEQYARDITKSVIENGALGQFLLPKALRLE